MSPRADQAPPGGRSSYSQRSRRKQRKTGRRNVYDRLLPGCEPGREGLVRSGEGEEHVLQVLATGRRWSKGTANSRDVRSASRGSRRVWGGGLLGLEWGERL